jgi:DNA-binding transcriptional MerR regulator
MKIGQLAREFGLSVPTLRYYDAIGLLKPAAVDPLTRYRRYDGSARRTLRFVRSAKALGFSLRQIARILKADRTGCACGVVSSVLHDRLARVRIELHRLKEQERRLARLNRAIPNAPRDRARVCPVVEKS